MEQAPFYAVPEGEPLAAAYWTSASDGVRLRVAAWDRQGA